MVVAFGIDIDIDLDTIYKYGNALLRILMATSPILIIWYNLLTDIRLLPSATTLTLLLAACYCSAYSKTCKKHYQSRVVKKKNRKKSRYTNWPQMQSRRNKKWLKKQLIELRRGEATRWGSHGENVRSFVVHRCTVHDTSYSYRMWMWMWMWIDSYRQTSTEMSISISISIRSIYLM